MRIGNIYRGFIMTNKWTRVLKSDDKPKETKVKAGFSWDWDNFSIEIDEVLFKDNFHLIVTFRDGTVKDVDAQMFMNHERLKGYFDELRDNIELFKHPISVCESGIMWTDMADISAKGLWKWGKEIPRKTASIKKLAFPRIKKLPCGIDLVNYSDEDVHTNTPHFHLFNGNTRIGTIAVDGPNKKIDKCKRGYKQDFKQVRTYVDNNKDLLTQIYNAKDGNTKQELAKKLP